MSERLTIEQVLSSLGPVKHVGDNWQAQCPAHDDHRASLSVGQGASGAILLKCHAGCDFEAIVQALHIPPAALFPPPELPSLLKKGRTYGAASKPVAYYDYRGLDGVVRFQVVRFAPKDFRQRQPGSGPDGWVWKMAGVQRIPYRLNELVGHELVYLVEGEKDADALWALGLPATTNAGGAGKWSASDSAGLVAAGVKRLVLVPDNDDPGRKHIDLVAKSVKACGIAVTVIALQNTPIKGDVSDWLQQGGSRAVLEGLVNQQFWVVPKGAVGDPTPVASVPDPFPYNTTDLGAAEGFLDRYRERVRYDHKEQQWLIWDHHHWKPDAMEEVMTLANDYARTLQHEAFEAVTDHRRRKEIIDFGLKLERRSQRENMLYFLRSIQPVSVDGRDTWDQDPWLLGCPNGVVDLRTGLLRDGHPTDMIARQTGVVYDPQAECPRFWRFLTEVFQGNVGLVDYLWRAFGYSLTADMSEQCWFLCYGAGANGKSTLLDVLEHVWGDYGLRANMRIFATTGQDTDTFNLADLEGKRLAFAAEIKPGSRINSDVIKNFTGGETARVERKYQHPFTLRPVGKIWLGINHLPKANDDSYGFWRRVRQIPFLETFSGDRGLAAELRSEGSGILTWAVRGCQEWRTRGLEAPAEVRAATAEYELAEDPSTDFFAQCVVADAACRVSFAAIYSAYYRHASDQGIPERDRVSRKNLVTKLLKRGYRRYLSGGMVFIGGARLVNPSKDLLTNEL